MRGLFVFQFYHVGIGQQRGINGYGMVSRCDQLPFPKGHTPDHAGYTTGLLRTVHPRP